MPVYPAYGCANVLAVDIATECTTSLDVDADHAVFCRPQHHVVIEGFAVGIGLYFVAQATGEKNEHRSVGMTVVGWNTSNTLRASVP